MNKLRIIDYAWEQNGRMFWLKMWKVGTLNLFILNKEGQYTTYLTNEEERILLPCGGKTWLLEHESGWLDYAIAYDYSPDLNRLHESGEVCDDYKQPLNLYTWPAMQRVYHWGDWFKDEQRKRIKKEFGVDVID